MSPLPPGQDEAAQQSAPAPSSGEGTSAEPGPPPADGTPGSGTPGAAGTPRADTDRDATAREKFKTGAADVKEQQVKDYAGDRGRVFRDSVVFSYCNIQAESFTGRDGLLTGASDLFRALVRPDYLKKLSDVYQDPDCAPAAAARLSSGRLVCLRGVEGVGRTALAIQLLRNIAKGQIYQIRPNTATIELTEAGFEQDCGYFLCLGPTEKITEFELARLRSICESGEFHLVLICAAEQTRALHDYAVIDVVPPPTDPIVLLRTHTLWGLEPEAGQAATVLLTCTEVGSWCEGSHRLAEIATVANILADVACGRIERDALATHLDLANRDGIRNWFSGVGREPLRALVITLSFFGGLPLHTVLELEDRLSICLREAAGESAPRDLFAASSRDRLSEVSAHISFKEHEDSYGAALTETVEFADRTWERSLASLLRTGYPAVRPILVGWLRGLADHPDPHVQRRAALALGGFARDSLPLLIHDVIEQWAMEADEETWLNVVWALTVPLALPDTAPRVARVLEQWATSDVTELVYCAAMVYGMALAPADAALSGLARIARRTGNDDEDWIVPAATGLLTMYFGEFADDALSAIRRWCGSKKKTHRDLALLTFVAIATLFETTVNAARSPYAEPGTAHGKPQKWPSLLLDACHHKTHGDVIAAAREALNRPEYSRDMLTALRGWFNRANDRPYLVRPLTNLMAALAATPAEAERLAYHMQAWAEKNPKGAAARVRVALLNQSSPQDGGTHRAGPPVPVKQR